MDARGSDNSGPSRRQPRSLEEHRAAELRRAWRMRRVQTIFDMRSPRVWFQLIDQTAGDLGPEECLDGRWGATPRLT